MGHGDPHVCGGLLGVHGVVQISEEVPGMFGVSPGMQGLSPEIVKFVLSEIVLIGDDESPVEMPQIIHGGGLPQPVGGHELPQLLDDVAHQLLVSSLRVLPGEAEGKPVEVQDDKFLGQSEEPFDALNRLEGVGIKITFLRFKPRREDFV